MFAASEKISRGESVRITPIVRNQCACLCHFERKTAPPPMSFRAQRNVVEKSGLWPNVLFVRRRISPLQPASRPSGRDDKDACFNHNWYYTTFRMWLNIFKILRRAQDYNHRTDSPGCTRENRISRYYEPAAITDILFPFTWFYIWFMIILIRLQMVI